MILRLTACTGNDHADQKEEEEDEAGIVEDIVGHALEDRADHGGKGGNLQKTQIACAAADRTGKGDHGQDGDQEHQNQRCENAKLNAHLEKEIVCVGNRFGAGQRVIREGMGKGYGSRADTCQKMV